tara:strand:- start:914 stop:1102 length:189 start_codon:yes stop_codon:yes gene_type:complete
MNDIIKQLEPQCWEHNEFGLNFNYRKFAELIVMECAEVGERYADGNYEVYNQILKRFGLEEE